MVNVEAETFHFKYSKGRSWKINSSGSNWDTQQKLLWGKKNLEKYLSFIFMHKSV